MFKPSLYIAQISADSNSNVVAVKTTPTTSLAKTQAFESCEAIAQLAFNIHGYCA